MHKQLSKQTGFTIVELLIVIVVIGILAAITIVAYNGIQNRAKVASLQSDLEQSTKLLDIYKLTTSISEQYPIDLATAQLKSSAGTSYTYYPTSSLRNYCLEATTASITYSTSNTSPIPQSGGCVTNSIVGWWTMNGNANDSSGNGNNGTVSGLTLTTGANGGTNGAYSMSGAAGQEISIPSSGLLNTLSRWTYSGWYKVDPTTPSYSMLAVKFAGDNACTFQIMRSGSSNYVAWAWSDGTTSYRNNGYSQSVFDGQWHLVTLSYDGSQVVAYVDAAVDGSWSFVGPSYLNSYPIVIGQRGGSYLTTGTVDDVRIYNRALAVSEVQSIYAASAR